MRNQELWKPSKVVLTRRGLRASKDLREAKASSRYTINRTAPLVGAAIEQHGRGRLLDLGAGKAPYYLVYRYTAETVTCVDWSAGEHGIDYLDQAHDLNEGVPFPDNSFDTIISTSVFEHIRQPDVLWAGAARTLTPGGKLILNVPFLYGVHEAPHDHFRYTEFALREYCSRHGFQVVSLEQTGGQFDVLVDLSAKMLDGIPKLAALYVAIMERIGATRPVETFRRTRKARAFPAGYVLVAVKS